MTRTRVLLTIIITMSYTVSPAILKAGLAALKFKAEIHKNNLLNHVKTQEKISAAGET